MPNLQYRALPGPDLDSSELAVLCFCCHPSGLRLIENVTIIPKF